MKRLSLISLALVSLLLGVSAAVGSRSTPALAETTIPAYGCGGLPFETDYNGNPIGGGLGYSETYSESSADYVATTAAQLKSYLAAASSGQVVYVKDGTTITLNSTSNMYSSSVGFYVRPGVILAGGRGGNGTAGIIQLASGFLSTKFYFLIQCGTGAQVVGLHIDGPYEGTTSGTNYWGAIKTSNETEIHNCEIHGFGYAAVYVIPDVNDVWVHHNYIHHCQQSGYGYGVGVDGKDIYHTASALVEGNYFDYNRHSVVGGRGRTSYVVRYNYFGANHTSSVVDCHGQQDNEGAYLQKAGSEYIYPAGEDIEVYNNTCIKTTGAFVRIRGTPYSTGGISVHNNWTYHLETLLSSGSGGYWAPICQQMWYMPEYAYNAPTGGKWIRMESYDNWWGTTPPPSTNGAPVLDAVGNKAVVELATLAFTISGTDPDGDTLTYSASNLPAGATFDPATRTFTWTPQDGQSGVYTGVHFQVSDGQITDYEDITITVSDGVQADVNNDGAVNSLDMIRVGQHWNETGPSGWIPEDINKDGVVNVLDATLVGQHWTG